MQNIFWGTLILRNIEVFAIRRPFASDLRNFRDELHSGAKKREWGVLLRPAIVLRFRSTLRCQSTRGSPGVRPQDQVLTLPSILLFANSGYVLSSLVSVNDTRRSSLRAMERCRTGDSIRIPSRKWRKYFASTHSTGSDTFSIVLNFLGSSKFWVTGVVNNYH